MDGSFFPTGTPSFFCVSEERTNSEILDKFQGKPSLPERKFRQIVTFFPCGTYWYTAFFFYVKKTQNVGF